MTYAYDNVNRISTATGMAFTWDDNGNLLTWDDGSDDWAYRYDSDNRLVNVKKNSVSSARYTYDAGGRRVRGWDTVEGTTDYVYSGLNVVDEVRGGAHEKHIYAGSMHLASNSSGTVEYFHVDHLGSTRLKTNSTGGVIYESNYEPYGPGYGESGSEKFRYTGKQEDSTGLYYFWARYYDPVTGRFTTRDSTFGDLSDPQSLNRYVYCQNNPHKYTDPDGKDPILANALIGGIIGPSIELIFYYATHRDNLDPREAAIAIAGGFVSGAITGGLGYALGSAVGRSIVKKAVGKMIIAHVANTFEALTEITLEATTNPDCTSNDIINEVGEAGYNEITVVGSTPSLDIAQSTGIISSDWKGDVLIEVIQTGLTYIPDIVHQLQERTFTISSYTTTYSYDYYEQGSYRDYI